MSFYRKRNGAPMAQNQARAPDFGLEAPLFQGAHNRTGNSTYLWHTRDGRHVEGSQENEALSAVGPVSRR